MNPTDCEYLYALAGRATDRTTRAIHAVLAELERLQAIEGASRILVADTTCQGASGTTFVQTHKLNHLRGALGEFAAAPAVPLSSGNAQSG